MRAADSVGRLYLRLCASADMWSASYLCGYPNFIRAGEYVCTILLIVVLDWCDGDGGVMVVAGGTYCQ